MTAPFKVGDRQLETVAYALYADNMGGFDIDNSTALTAWATDPEIVEFWTGQAKVAIQSLVDAGAPVTLPGN